ncbi:BnaCnng75400D, partial [Brassica napus]
IPRPSYRLGLGLNSLLPVFNHKPWFKQCILKRIAVFLFRFQTPFGTDYLLIGVSEGESGEQGWTKLEGRFTAYRDMVSFKGKFYVVDMSGQGHVFVIEPSFEITEIQAVTLTRETYDERLVVSGDELFLVQRFTLGMDCNEYEHSWFRLFRLEEDGQRRWVRINDIKDRVVFLGCYWSLCCSAKELPGMKGNSVVFKEPNNCRESIFVFDLKTMKTSNAFTECRGYMFGKNREPLLSCGILTHRIQQTVLHHETQPVNQSKPMVWSRKRWYYNCF